MRPVGIEDEILQELKKLNKNVNGVQGFLLVVCLNLGAIVTLLFGISGKM